MQVIFYIDYEPYYLANFGVQRCMLRNNLSLRRSFPLIHASKVNNGSIGIIERSFNEKPGVSLNCCSCTNFLSTKENVEAGRTLVLFRKV